RRGRQHLTHGGNRVCGISAAVHGNAVELMTPHPAAAVDQVDGARAPRREQVTEGCIGARVGREQTYRQRACRFSGRAGGLSTRGSGQAQRQETAHESRVLCACAESEHALPFLCYWMAADTISFKAGEKASQVRCRAALG